MAATRDSVLPTYQRYINGVPVPQNRKTLRLREKYIVLLVFVTFGTVCFGAFFFLPDLRDRVSVTGFHENFVQNVFLPKPEDSHRVARHDPDSPHGAHQADMKSFGEKVKAADIPKVWNKLNISEGEHNEHKEEIEKDKDKFKQQRIEEEKKKAEEEKEKNLEERKDHQGVEGAQGGVPADEETKLRQDTVRNVSVAHPQAKCTFMCTWHLS